MKKPPVFRRIRARWNELKKLEPGKRFETVYRKQKDKPLGAKIAFFGLAVVMFAAGVLFAFIPGPAVLFFALSAALLSTQSRWVARKMDQGEVWGRTTLKTLRARWKKKRRERELRQRARHAG